MAKGQVHGTLPEIKSSSFVHLCRDVLLNTCIHPHLRAGVVCEPARLFLCTPPRPCRACCRAPSKKKHHHQQPVTPTVNPESEKSDLQLTAAAVVPSIASTAESISDA